MDNISFDELKPLREKKADEYQPDEEGKERYMQSYWNMLSIWEWSCLVKNI
jgi:hypothetical protein